MRKGKKDKKFTHAAHIKRHTEGTSNELSFSVLDAAKNRVDSETGNDKKIQTPRFGGIALFVFPLRKKRTNATPARKEGLPLRDVVSDKDSLSLRKEKITGETLSLSSISSGYLEEEITRRKTHRRRRRVVLALLSVLLLGGLLGGGSFFIYKEVSHHQEQVSLLDQALATIAENDKEIIKIDKVVNEGIDNENPEDITFLLEEIPRLKETLSETKELAQQAADSMRDSSDKNMASQALSAIEAREEMLDASATIIRADLSVKKETEAINKAWNMVLEADGKAREAALLVVDTTPENVARSKEKSLEAQNLLNEAHQLFLKVDSSELQPDMHLVLEYIAKRKESMEYALASDDALIARDRQTAESKNELYNKADGEATAKAKELPDEITSLLIDARMAYTHEAQEKYLTARLQASTADAFLRDYLGTWNK